MREKLDFEIECMPNDFCDLVSNQLNAYSKSLGLDERVYYSRIKFSNGIGTVAVRFDKKGYYLK